MAGREHGVSLMSGAALQLLKLGMAMGTAESYAPEMGDIARALNRPPAGRGQT